VAGVGGERRGGTEGAAFFFSFFCRGGNGLH
jgi:hypothetical protein